MLQPMTPQRMTKELLEDLINNYDITPKLAVQMAMFAVDKVINYEDIHTSDFWMEVMDELDNL
jgi:hypothetical protein